MVKPEMLWESADPDAELGERFGFASAHAATAWAAGVLAEAYSVRVSSVDRMVISHDNLMVWVTTETAGRLIVKVCRHVEQHGHLTACGRLVRWLGDRGVPVAAPLPAGGEHQIVRDGHSVGVQPVLPGELLDAGEPDQVRAAGVMLAELHRHLADWPDRGLLAGAEPRPTFTVSERIAEVAPADVLDRLHERSAGLPGLPQQVVHADFRAANLLVRDGQITGVLDFEEARVGAAVADLARATCLLGTWFHDWAPVPPEAQALFLDSYTARRSLSDVEQQWLEPLVGWIMLSMGWFDEARRWLP